MAEDVGAIRGDLSSATVRLGDGCYCNSPNNMIGGCQVVDNQKWADASGKRGANCVCADRGLLNANAYPH